MGLYRDRREQKREGKKVVLNAEEHHLKVGEGERKSRKAIMMGDWLGF